MKVCITGVAGFIGSNLVESCLDFGWEVVGVDNFATGYRDMIDPNRFMNRNGKFTFVEINITDQNLYKYLDGVDVVFHLAALPRVSFSIDYPIEANEANVNGTLNVLESARKAGVQRVVFSCSSSIFGGVAQFPTPETATPHPKSPYALHKYTGAEYCRLYSELHGLDTVCLLYFNVFGKYQRAGSAYATVIPAFFEAGMNGTSCRIDGSGDQSRDFCHIDNVVQANILAANSSNSFGGEKFNIACGDHNSVNDVFDEVKEMLKIPLQKYHVDPRLGDPIKSHADISKAVKVLGYSPDVKFDEGMKKTAQWWLAGCPTIF